ncbi:hypothetical protein ACVNF4_07960, partial [Streptomyces sp. S6]
MTQSGQGEEPSARPAREGIVLPSDGGAPLLPGMTGASAVPPAPRYDPQPDPSPVTGQGWTPPPAQPSHPTTQSWPLPPEGAQSPVTYGQGAPAPSYGQAQPSAYDQAPVYQQPAMDEAATQYIPPVVDGGYPNSGGFQGSPGGFPGSEGATQYLPPVPSVEEGATQVLPPIPSGALPPEMGSYPGADSAPTQVIPPVPADGGPPAGFENLFRDTPATTPPPRPQQTYGGPPRQPAPAGYAPQDAYDDGGGRGRAGRSRSKVPMIAAAGVALAAVGIGVGALMGSGGDGKSDNNSTNVATSADEGQGGGQAAGGGAEAQ